MKVLIYDRSDSSAQLLKTKLEELNYEVFLAASKDEALKMLGEEEIRVVFADPSPQTSLRPFLQQARRAALKYFYLFHVGENIVQDIALKNGANNGFKKPFDFSALSEAMGAAKNFISLMDRLGDASVDYPNADGIISKSAFYQLFSSAADRGDRYGEKNYVIFFSIANFDDILRLDGKTAVKEVLGVLARDLVKSRRRADIIGQIANNVFALLIMNPSTAEEPVEAILRYADVLSKGSLLALESGSEVEMHVSLLNVPVGENVKAYKFKTEGK